MNKKSVNRTILHLLFFFAGAMWLVAVLVRAARTDTLSVGPDRNIPFMIRRGWPIRKCMNVSII